MDAATDSFTSKKLGRKKNEAFSNKEEAETAYKQLQEENQALKKELEGLKIQRDFAEFRLELRTKTKKKKALMGKKKNGF